MKTDKITVLRSSQGVKGGVIRVYVGHHLVWSKRWTSIDQMFELERRVKALVEPMNQKLRLVREAS